MAETPYDDLRIHFQHLRRPLMSDDGKALLAYLEQRFCERRTLVTEQTADGTTYTRLTRVSSHTPGDPYDIYRREGNREVVLFLKDLLDMEE